jgi:hypothetical protein
MENRTLEGAETYLMPPSPSRTHKQKKAEQKRCFIYTVCNHDNDNPSFSAPSSLIPSSVCHALQLTLMEGILWSPLSAGAYFNGDAVCAELQHY